MDDVLEFHQKPRAPEGLLRLARAHGVGTSFRGWDGAEHDVAETTLRQVLAAMDVRAGTAQEIAGSLAGAESGPWQRLLPAVVVLHEGQQIEVPVHAREGSDVHVWIVAEDGTRHEMRPLAGDLQSRDVAGVPTSRLVFAVPEHLPLGWHVLHARYDDVTAECGLVVTPARLATASLNCERNWGLMAQLYSVRSSRSWGIGDFLDMADLAAISGAEYGAGFLLVNPLHAGDPVPPVEPSPYLPSSRRFFHPLYIRVEDIPEYGYLPDGDRARVESWAADQHRANYNAEMLDRNTAYTAKLAALELVHAVKLSPARAAQFTAFLDFHGQDLDDFALWCALAENFPADAPQWSAEFYSPHAPGARAQREVLADRIGFYRWLQWICDQQLEAAQRSAKDAGMDIGIMHDLAVGVDTHGADAWMLRDVLARGVTVGAPPDMFNQQGQNWTQPPWHPAGLESAGYAPYRDMLRNLLRHAGGIRVDHILGLFRLWWIPEGKAPGEGTYVYYNHEALIGILALEAQRAGAVVIGEDLGVFEPWVREYLAERGIFGTSILWFESENGKPLPPEKYRRSCLTSVNTHDLPPTAGYLAGEHVSLRESLGLLNRPVEQERAADAAAQGQVFELLRSRGFLAPGQPAADASGKLDERAVRLTVEALYEFTAATPSSLLGVALVDAVGEMRTQNQPGTRNEYPNWRIPLAGADGKVFMLDDLPGNERLASLVAAVGGRQHS
ncbi:4-alpha-glucanotransferase [Arthrobacter sp. H14-L1]|uniref:4-alpha-glucanotransferase n=1 Tax=Arthrobacter sp. H14-L1 TaxID=2996697 RepID=UPI00226FC7A0|nr:4-alpha-glucanotransferase [Arthrobacter sp. H14-L1]MCY0903925.1 4-alpha-glucanotransferase [Arthrobacter sp. H14-L1]